MQFIKTTLDDVFEIRPEIHGDKRGFFTETFRESIFQGKLGSDIKFVQDNHSGSKKGTLRGIHYQLNKPQGKLVRVVKGEIFDVAVDLRRSSPNFGKWVGLVLNEEKKNQVWIPPGFGHAFYVLSEWAEIVYKVTDYYDRDDDFSILWNDPQIGVKWPIKPNSEPTLSYRDKKGYLLSSAKVYD